MAVLRPAGIPLAVILPVDYRLRIIQGLVLNVRDADGTIAKIEQFGWVIIAINCEFTITYRTGIIILLIEELLLGCVEEIVGRTCGNMIHSQWEVGENSAMDRAEIVTCWLSICRSRPRSICNKVLDHHRYQLITYLCHVTSCARYGTVEIFLDTVVDACCQHFGYSLFLTERSSTAYLIDN